MSTLTVSEVFYSIQGEGPTVGSPAVFLRLTGCKMGCRFCDTSTWRSGTRMVFKDVWEKIMVAIPSAEALCESVHLVITGGEPLLQQDAVIEFLCSAKDGFLPHNRALHCVEMETACTVMPNAALFHFVDRFNCSPKLANCGIPMKRRWHPMILNKFADQTGSIFKFVVRHPNSLREIRAFADKHSGVSRDRIYLMPQCQTRDGWNRYAPPVIEFCKQEGFTFSPRLQVALWDSTQGV